MEAERLPTNFATAKTAESAEDVVDVVKAAIDLAGYVPAKFERHHQTMVREWMTHPEIRVLTMRMDADGALQISSSWGTIDGNSFQYRAEIR